MKISIWTPQIPQFSQNERCVFGDEAVRHDVTDFLFFTLIAGLPAWPIASMTMAIARMIG